MADNFLSRMLGRAKQVDSGVAKLMAQVGNNVGTSLVLETPVDTGAARSNWLPSTGSPRTEPVPPTSAPAAIAAITAVTARLKSDDEFYLANNLDYIRRLNDGWSKQAPAGFVDAAVQRARRPGTKVELF